MAEHGSVARPYAQAVFEMARDAGQLPAWSEFLNLAGLLVAEPAVNRMLTVPGADLKKLVSAIADLCRENLASAPMLSDGDRSTGANFLKLLVENRRLGALLDIAAHFEVLRAEAENILEATLTASTPVSEQQQAGIVASLKKRFGRQIRLTVKQDPSLIGGAYLQVGDRVIDGSVRTGLDKLATALRA